MNLTSKLTLFLLFIATTLLISFTKAGRKKKIVFFGDSITEQGAKPGGYIKIIDSLMNVEAPDSGYSLMGAGISGNKVYDLYLRMEEDVISKSPDLTIIYIGINDVWHKRTGTGTDEDRYLKFYKAIINKLKYNGSKIILCTPSVIGERKDCTNPQDGDLNRYSNIVRKLAKEHELPLVDLHQLFQNYLMDNNPENLDKGILTTDGVHLNKQGNNFVANAMWQEIKKMKL